MTQPTREILLGRYLLLQQHQTGGMASVHRARDIDRDVLVAVKRFDRDRLLPELEAEAYRREVEALRNLSHPNILRILDQGQDERGRPFLVLEWMSHDLVEHRRRAAAAFNGWDDFAEQVALPLLDALAHAHANGFCHRDVKPANVLIGDDGTIKLADFGVSKLKRCLLPRITLNEFISPPYAPPEPDDGAHSYARDVYSFAVLCLWALSDRPLHDMADIPTALDRIDVVRDVRDILTRCLAADPAVRPGTAGLLSHELVRVQARRAQVWAAQSRKRCRVRLTRTARDDVARHIGQGDEGAVQSFADQDMNDDSTVERVVANRGRPGERTVPGKYYVHGGRLSFQLSSDDRGGDNLVLIGAQARDPDWLQRVKASTVPSPLTFDVVPRKGGIPAGEAANLLEEVLAEFDAARLREQADEAEDKVFASWANVLDARITFERERCSPIQFSDRTVEGQFVTLRVEAGLDGVELEQARVVETDGKWIRGVVESVIGNEVVLHCPTADFSKFPRAGRARLDTYATDSAIEHQRTALALVRARAATRSDLRGILLAPGECQPPGGTAPGLGGAGLDPSQQAALEAALAAPDVLLVEGPPGTGKTRFIAHLIRETLARNPRARVLLTSQTHVALDNALERLAAIDPELRMLRIARPGASVVADSCQAYVVDSQLGRWREAVASGSAAWLADWATRQGLDPNEISTGILVKRIGALRQEVPRLREALKATEAKLEQAKRRDATAGPDGVPIDPEGLTREADDLRIQLDSGKKYVDQLEAQLRKRRPHDAQQFLTMTPAELAEWSEVLVGTTERGRRAEAVMNLQAEWLDRFGRDPSFLGALCERSLVVAATCIGLASLPGSAEVTYDLCIIDEASKATATEAIVPMARARKWVLVGDSRQLPPFEDEVHRSEDLRQRFEIDDEEAVESLFERFRRLLPAGCQKMLSKQHRMVPPIGRMISECFYDGKIDSENGRTLDPCLISVTGRAVSWITTRYLDDRHEQRDGTTYVNPAEVSRILELLEEFDGAVAGPGPAVKVRVLSGYAAQVRLLQSCVDRARYSFPHLAVQCNTIDSVQGQEADLVIFSVTRSNPDLRAGFLNELTRINVALSRAGEALVIVGDDQFVRKASGAEPLQRVLCHIESRPDECTIRAFDPPGAPKGVHK